MKRDPTSKKPITYKNVLFFLGLFALFGCPCLEGSSPPEYISPPSVISVEGLPTQLANSEEVTITVRTSRAAGEQVGQNVTVTPTVSDGATITPTTRTVALAEGDATTTFVARTPAEGYSSFAIVATRTDHSTLTDKSAFRGSAASQVVPNLVAMTFDPTSLVVNRGGSATFDAHVLPRGNTRGAVTLGFDVGGQGVTCTPAQFVVNLTEGSTTPVTQRLTVAANTNAPLGPMNLFGYVRSGVTKQQITTYPLAINAGSGTPHFTFTATPSQVTSAMYQQSAPVTYTLTSVNGFIGSVVVSQQADGEVGISPTSDDETFAVSPTAPATFTRRFTRYYGQGDIRITFTATHAASSTSRTVVTTVKP